MFEQRVVITLTHFKRKLDWTSTIQARLADAKSTPSYSSDLHLSVLKNRPDRGQLICLKICLFFIFLDKARTYTSRTYCQTYYTPPMLQISDFGRSDRDLHLRSDNYKVRGIRGSAFSIRLSHALTKPPSAVLETGHDKPFFVQCGPPILGMFSILFRVWLLQDAHENATKINLVRARSERRKESRKENRKESRKRA